MYHHIVHNSIKSLENVFESIFKFSLPLIRQFLIDMDYYIVHSDCKP